MRTAPDEVHRTSYRCEPKPDRNAKLRQELIELAKRYPRLGGESQTYRALYRQEQLMVRRLKRKRLSRLPQPMMNVERANQEWSMDFVMDGLATGRAIRALTVVDSCTRECPAIRSGQLFVESPGDPGRAIPRGGILDRCVAAFVVEGKGVSRSRSLRVPRFTRRRFDVVAPAVL